MGDDNIIIRLKDVYEIADRTERKVDRVLEAVPDHEVRLRKMEQRVYALPSLAVLMAIASLVVGILALTHHSATPPTPQSSRAPSTTVAAPVKSPVTAATVEVTQPVRRAPAPTTAAAPTTTTTTPPPPVTVPVPQVTVPKPVTTLVDRIENLTKGL